MITGLGSVAILVNDARMSAEWYRDKFGFEILGTEGHSVFVKPKGVETLLHLCGKCDDWGTDRPGGRTGIWFRSGELTTRRVEETGPGAAG